MKKILMLLLTFLSPVVFAQSHNFEGFGLSFDYAVNSITDKSTPGGTVTSRSGMPSITADFYKAFSDGFLVGVYGNYDLGTTDTTSTDPDAHNPIEFGGKIGYAITEKLMAYAKLGYSWSKYSSPGYYSWMNGPSYGIGAEYLITKNLFSRVEVSQQNYRTITWGDGSTDKVYINTYGASLGWRF